MANEWGRETATEHLRNALQLLEANQEALVLGPPDEREERRSIVGSVSDRLRDALRWLDESNLIVRDCAHDARTIAGRLETIA